MTLLTTTTKTMVPLKAAKGAAKHPGVLFAGARAGKPATKLGLAVGKPYARHQARQRVDQLGDAVKTAGEVVSTYGPQIARELGLVEQPKPKRTAPRVAAGVVIGASAMYLLEPGHGREHREQLRKMVA